MLTYIYMFQACVNTCFQKKIGEICKCLLPEDYNKFTKSQQQIYKPCIKAKGE